MTTYTTITLDQADGIATLTLNRPEKLNALNETLLMEMRGAVMTMSMERGVRVLILTGAGKAFAAGADIGAMSEMAPARAKLFADGGARSRRGARGGALPGHRGGQRLCARRRLRDRARLRFPLCE